MPERVCLLTGASSVLGTEFCRRYGSRYRISAIYRTHRPEPPGDPLFAIRSDLAEEGELGRVVELTLARFGRIDLLVNAAVHYAVWEPIVSPALLDSLERQFLVNTMVPLRLAAEVATAFWRTRDVENRASNRNVVNVSSIAGVEVLPRAGQSAYGASKAALNHLTYHMAAEFEEFGVRVNATAPAAFPSLVATERAAESIVRLDEGSMNGCILVLTESGEQVL